MSTRRTADGPRRAYIVRSGREGVVFSFSKVHANRVDRWEVDDVEAHYLRIIQSLDAVAEGRVLVVTTFGVAREKLIPCGESRTFPLDDDPLHVRDRR